jgi:PKD repeat protein
MKRRNSVSRVVVAVVSLMTISFCAPETALAQNKAPTANFQADPRRGDVPLTVQFTDGSSDADGIARWSWDFGDGTIGTDPNPIHTYTLPGRYDVTLVVTDNQGATATKSTREFITVDPPRLLAAVLPLSRSVQLGQTATAFVSVINSGAITASGVGISVDQSTQPPVPATFTFQTTDPRTNQPTGSLNARVDIPAGGTQSYVIALTPSAAFGPTEVRFEIEGANTDAARIVSGINTLLLSASTAPTADVVALATTVDSNGLVQIPGPAGAVAAFAVATVNLAAPATITVSADTGAAGPVVALSLCRTDPGTGQCVSEIAPTVQVAIGSGDTPTFAVFVAATSAIPFDPVRNRIFVRFTDGAGVTRGATSVAVRTQ